MIHSRLGSPNEWLPYGYIPDAWSRLPQRHQHRCMSAHWPAQLMDESSIVAWEQFLLQRPLNRSQKPVRCHQLTRTSLQPLQCSLDSTNVQVIIRLGYEATWITHQIEDAACHANLAERPGPSGFHERLFSLSLGSWRLLPNGWCAAAFSTASAI